MATLEKIRSKGVLLMIVIGIALVAFIVGDFVRRNPQPDAIAKINGKEIKWKDYQNAINQLTDVYKIEYNTSSLDENTTTQIRQSVWDALLRSNLIGADAEKIGLAVGEKELEELTLGTDKMMPHPMITQRRIFANPSNGMFDRNRLIGLLTELKTPPTSPEMAEQYNTLKNYWLYFENTIKTGTLENKYNALLSRALKANSVEAKLAFESKKPTVDVVYIAQPYATIADDKVTVSDKEIAAKYKEIKEKYKQAEETREIKFVSFDVKPSDEDFQKEKVRMDSLKPKFEASQDVKLIVNANSKPYQDVALSAKDIDPDLKSFAFSGRTGEVFGPALFGNTYKMARIMANGIMTPDSFEVRHIVIFDQDSLATKTLADSVFTAIKGGANFAAMAAKYSQNQATAQQGGNVGWLTESMITNMPGLGSMLVNTPVNTLFTYKEGGAIQLMEIMKKTANVSKVKLAVIESNVTPSRETYNTIYGKAKQLASESLSGESFEKNAQKAGYMIQSSPAMDRNMPNLYNIKNSRQIVRWAFEHEKGQVSDVYDCESQFVVAELTGINPKGYKSLESVTPEIKAALVNDKKADMIIADLAAKKAANIQALAAQLTVKADTAQQVNFESSSFGNRGFEPAAIVAASLSELNKLSAPVKGNQGVYVMQAYNKYENPMPFDAKMEKNALSTRYAYAVYMSFEALREKADIEDNRYTFY